MKVDSVALGVFAGLFALVTVLGFAAVRWRRAESLAHLDEWGLGGRRFGGFVTWFLLGGDLYTAYTFIAVPALMYGVGATGFFAVPYTIIVFPLVFPFLVREELEGAGGRTALGAFCGSSGFHPFLDIPALHAFPLAVHCRNLVRRYHLPLHFVMPGNKATVAWVLPGARL